jgi:hypothetical protein
MLGDAIKDAVLRDSVIPIHTYKSSANNTGGRDAGATEPYLHFGRFGLCAQLTLGGDLAIQLLNDLTH